MDKVHVLLQLTLCLSLSVTVSTLCPQACVCVDTKAVCTGHSFNGSSIPSFSSKITSLTLRNMNLMELADYAFVDKTHTYHILDKLTSLYLDNCNLHTITQNAFARLDNLQVLSITHNQLTNQGFMANYSLNKLDKVYLTANLFRTIPQSIFTWAPNVFKLAMGHNKLETIVLPDTDRQLRDLILDGNNFGNLTPDKVKCRNNSIMTMSLVDCNITNIHKDSLNELSQLQSLDLSGNIMTAENLTASLQGLGNATTSLRRLTMTHMQMVNVTSKMFSTLNEIRGLNLSLNRIENVEPDAFSQITKLNTLLLDNNQLTSMVSVAKVQSLAYLSLRHNKIEELESLRLSTKNELRKIDLSFNFISKLKNHWILDQTKIGKIDLSNNQIRMIDQNAMRNVTVKTVDLSHNHIITTKSSGMRVHILNLSHNNIKHVTPSSMKSLYSYLDDLDLSYNQITSIDSQIFQDFYTMEKLNLSHNQMGPHFSEGHHLNLFSHLQHLRVLDLSYNGITKFPHMQFIQNPHIANLSLKGNAIEDINDIPCSYLCDSLQFLDMSQNRLKTIDRVCLARMLFLKKVDFSANPFDCTCSLAEFMHWLKNDSYHAHVDVVGLNDAKLYHCSSPKQWANKSLLQYHPVRGSCEYHRQNDHVNMTVVAITVGLVTVAVVALSLVLYFGKVFQKLRNLQYNWQVRYKEVNDGDLQVII